MENDSKSIRSYTVGQLEELVTGLGQPKFRANQLHEWLHTHNAASYDEMTNLPKALRERLKADFPLENTSIVEVHESSDGTRKYLLKFSDGAIVECVGIVDGRFPNNAASKEDSLAGGRADDEEEGRTSKDGEHVPRLTVCCSTQVGCAMKCAFCATGQQGLTRNLTADEIVAQVVAVGNDFGTRVANVVIMGQGEPFQNYEATLEAIRRMNSDAGLAIGARHITVSTSGLCDGIKRLGKEPEQFRLAVSLHSADQATRNAIMPRLSGENLKKLHSVLEQYCIEKGRRVTLEYMLLEGVNDSEEDLEKLEGFCEGLNVHVNLLPFNAVKGAAFSPSSSATVNKWKVFLENNGINCSVRKSKGSDIAGACGQLKATSIE